MKKRIVCMSTLIFGLMTTPHQLAAMGINDEPGLSQFDFSCDTASVQEGFLCSLETSGSTDPGYSVEANLGAGIHLIKEIGFSVNLAGGVFGWENDEDYSFESFYYGLAGGKVSCMFDGFSVAVDVRFRILDSTDELTSPEMLFPSVLFGFGEEEFLTLGIGGQGISLVFHWTILHFGIYYQPPPLFCDFNEFGIKIAIGRY